MSGLNLARIVVALITLLFAVFAFFDPAFSLAMGAAALVTGLLSVMALVETARHRKPPAS